MYGRQERRDTENDVYLANFTAGTPMHCGIRSRVDSVLDERKLLSDSKHIKSIICPLSPPRPPVRARRRHVLPAHEKR